MAKYEFTRKPIAGFEYECLLLEQWAAWVRSDCIVQSLSKASPMRDLWMNESEIEKAEAALLRVHVDHRRVLKGWFLFGNVDYEQSIIHALFRFREEIDQGADQRT